MRIWRSFTTVLPALILLVAALFAKPALAGLDAPLDPEYLRCEYRVDPLGIDVTKPRLSWRLASAERGEKQTAYQVLVATSPELLKEGSADLWDSGKTTSDDTTAIVYAGKPLESHMACFWKVRIWDASDQASAWSDPARWSMGLLDPTDWKAEWIGYDKERTGEKPGQLFLPPPSYLRTTFKVDKPVRRATVYATALGIYDLHLNGSRVSDDYFNPGWTDYTKRVYYRAYDVTDRIKQGQNALGAILADGWYSGYIGYLRQRDHYGKKPRFRAQLHLEFNDGTTADIATGPNWKASTGPIREADFLMGETFDARRGSAWETASFDDAKWQPVIVGAELNPKVQAHPGPPVVDFAQLGYQNITEPKPGSYVLNMGQNFAGVAALTMIMPKANEHITLRFAERLNPDGTVYTTNLRSARATDSATFYGAWSYDWQPRFTFHGFQYIEATGFPKRPESGVVVGHALSSDTPRVGHFECSNKMLNQLASNIYWTQRANFIDIPTDCPQRDERLGWTGDAQVYCRTATLNTDVQAFFTKWLVDLDDAQRADGEFPMVAPLKVAGDDGGPAWADAGVICPWTMYLVYGDRRLLEKHYPAMTRFIGFCEHRSTPDLLPPKQFHCFGDWLNINAETPKDVIYEAYFARSTSFVAQAAEALGKTDDAAKYHALFDRIKASFNKAYVAADGRIKGNTQTAYVLALAFGLLDPQHQKLAAKYLVADIKSRGWHLSTGFIGTKDLMNTLSQIGRNDVAYRLILNDTFPSWGFSIKQGATSIWERWDGWTPQKGFQTPGMNSFAHYSFGAVYQWMVENIGGIRSDGVAYKRIIIAPQPGGDLTWADVRYNSIRGEIASHWHKEDGQFKLEVTIPPNTTATVVIPAKSSDVISCDGNVLSATPEVKLLHRTSDRATLAVESGKYSFLANTPIPARL